MSDNNSVKSAEQVLSEALSYIHKNHGMMVSSVSVDYIPNLDRGTCGTFTPVVSITASLTKQD